MISQNNKLMNKQQLILGLTALCVASSGAATVWNLGTTDTGRATPETASLYGTSHNVTFVQEANVNPLPGDPNSPAVNSQADDDYYFAGIYNNQVDGGPAYAPLGPVVNSEISVERAFTSGDTSLRYHFNFAAATGASDVHTVTFQMLDMDDDGTGTGAYDIDLLVNGVLMNSFTHSAATIESAFISKGFVLGDINATAGAPDDNYVELRVTNPGVTSARWTNMDYVRMDVQPVPEPSASLYLLGLAGLGLVYRRRK